MAEKTKNLCAQIPESLHDTVRTRQQESGKTLKPQKQDVPDEQEEAPAPAPEDVVEVEIDQDDEEPGEVRP